MSSQTTGARIVLDQWVTSSELFSIVCEKPGCIVSNPTSNTFVEGKHRLIEVEFGQGPIGLTMGISSGNEIPCVFVYSFHGEESVAQRTGGIREGDLIIALASTMPNQPWSRSVLSLEETTQCIKTYKRPLVLRLLRPATTLKFEDALQSESVVHAMSSFILHTPAVSQSCVNMSTVNNTPRHEDSSEHQPSPTLDSGVVANTLFRFLSELRRNKAVADSGTKVISLARKYFGTRRNGIEVIDAILVNDNHTELFDSIEVLRRISGNGHVQDFNVSQLEPLYNQLFETFQHTFGVFLKCKASAHLPDEVRGIEKRFVWGLGNYVTRSVICSEPRWKASFLEFLVHEHQHGLFVLLLALEKLVPTILKAMHLLETSQQGPLEMFLELRRLRQALRKHNRAPVVQNVVAECLTAVKGMCSNLGYQEHIEAVVLNPRSTVTLADSKQQDTKKDYDEEMQQFRQCLTRTLDRVRLAMNSTNLLWKYLLSSKSDGATISNSFAMRIKLLENVPGRQENVLKHGRFRMKDAEKGIGLHRFRKNSNDIPFEDVVLSWVSEYSNQNMSRKQHTNQDASQLDQHHSDQDASKLDQHHSDQDASELDQHHSDQDASQLDQHHSDQDAPELDQHHSDQDASQLDQHHSDQDTSQLDQHHSDQLRTSQQVSSENTQLKLQDNVQHKHIRNPIKCAFTIQVDVGNDHNSATEAKADDISSAIQVGQVCWAREQHNSDVISMTLPFACPSWCLIQALARVDGQSKWSKCFQFVVPRGGNYLYGVSQLFLTNESQISGIVALSDYPLFDTLRAVVSNCSNTANVGQLVDRKCQLRVKECFWQHTMKCIPLELQSGFLRSLNRILPIKSAGLGHDLLLNPLQLHPFDLPLNLLFDTLGIEQVITLISALLAERKLLVVSKSLSLLVICLESLMKLILPFKWEQVYIPVLPVSLLGSLECPTPFVMGIHESYAFKRDFPFVVDVVVVDLDKGSIRSPVNDPIQMLPGAESLEHELQKEIKCDLELYDDGNTSCLSSVSKEADWFQVVRIVYTHIHERVAHPIAKYASTIQSIDEELVVVVDENALLVALDQTTFVHRPFFELVLRTQLLSSFLCC